MLAITGVCELPAPPEYVWPLYTNPAAWKTWSADIQRASIKVPLKVGAKGRCKYRMLPEGEFTIVAFDEPHSFTLDWVTLLTHVRFEHSLAPAGRHGTHVRERISFSGLLAPILGLVERPRIRADWPRAMDCLGELALEKYRSSPPSVAHQNAAWLRRFAPPPPRPRPGA
jgi:uncharacterized protein YndB with AHSA1/START domain